jgi:hypothetical protein
MGLSCEDLWMSEMNKDLESLKGKYDALQKEIWEISEKIDALELNEGLPKLREKYNDTYWAFNNGYNKKERWIEYIHVIEITGLKESSTKCNKFFIDCYGDIHFITGKSEYRYRLEKQITRQQYERERNRIIQRILDI